VLNDDGDVVLLSWVNTFNYALRPFEVDVPQKEGPATRGFNFQLKSLDLVHTTILKSEFGTPEVPALVNWIERSIDSYVSNENTFTLFKSGFDLGLYFSSISTFKFDVEDGLLVGGKPVIAPTMKNNDMTKEFFKLLRESL